ncbi:MAG: glutamine amidotransferase subunit PdxT [Armatimonadetes bacterium 55-13]|nr:pyridoxal 5'-phosphate synthase glutaminase subunit PdxT [Armatimonadota bacterium]OJU63015.1 MAG: glutamine amidotransferase subunit PdxT [Armatimonadetes bacterium 55-13]
MPTVGVVAVQGDFEKHIEALERCSIPGLIVREVRVGEDLAQVDRVIIPGGESTTVGMLMQRFGLAEALQEAASNGMPIWGTCMGMILMAQTIEDRPHQFSLGLLNITVRRNAFGAQVHSFEDEVQMEGIDTPVMGVFIRAPIVTDIKDPAIPVASYQGKVVAVRQGKLLGTSFHPELTDDVRLHQWFLGI